MPATVTLINPDGKRVEVYADRVDFAIGIGWKYPAIGNKTTTRPPFRDPQSSSGGGIDQQGHREANLGRTSQQLFNDTKVLWSSMDGALVITGSNVVEIMRQAIADGYTGPTDIMRVSQGLNLQNFLGGVGHANWQMAMHAWYNGADQSRVGETGAEREEFLFGREPGGGGGGGGFGRAVGPVYVKPDRDGVFEFLTDFVVATTGQLDNDLINLATDQFLKTDRQDFDDKGQQHDPTLAAKNLIRNSSVYKDIHELRPESSNEMQWVTSQQGLLRQLGVSADVAETLGIKLARVGASKEAAGRAGEKAFTAATGRIAADQRNRLKQSASAVLGLL